MRLRQILRTSSSRKKGKTNEACKRQGDFIWNLFWLQHAQLLRQREHPATDRDLLQAPKKADARGAALLDRSCFRIAPGLSHVAQTVSRPALAGASFEPSVCEISAAIKDYVLPIFKLFGDLDLHAEAKKFYKEFLYYDLGNDEFNYILNGLDPNGK